MNGAASISSFVLTSKMTAPSWSAAVLISSGVGVAIVVMVMVSVLDQVW